MLGAQAGLLPYGDPELFVPFLEDKSTGLWLLPLLPLPQTHNGVNSINNAEPRSKTCLQRFVSQHCARQHRTTILYGISQGVANDNSTYINTSHFRSSLSRSIRFSKQPPPFRAYLDETSLIAQHRQNSATSIENAQSQMSCMHRFQS